MTFKTYIKALWLLLAVGVFSACSDNDMATKNEDKKPVQEVKGVQFVIESPKASAKVGYVADEDGALLGARTRTTISHTFGGGADVLWTNTDKIWVKDKNGTWQQSIATVVTSGGKHATFTLPGNMSDYNDNCSVSLVSSDIKSSVLSTYTSNTGLYTSAASGANPTPATGIANIQNQTDVNKFDKAGQWGDCAVGKAKHNGTKFSLSLEHQAAYLCVLPRCENPALGRNIKLTHIKIESDNVIASDLIELQEDGTLNLPTAAAASSLNHKTITASVNNFPLNTDVTNAATNACYFVVYPGTHNLTIRYTIKDYDTNVETTLTKKVNNVVCNAGSIADITANLMPLGFYYIWDARRDYWDGIESEIPVIDSDGVGTTVSSNYPRAESPDARWSEQTHLQPQTTLFKNLPNLNEMMWYFYHGDPHFSYDQDVVIANRGHLHKTTAHGVWFRKKSVILAYLKTIGYPSTMTEEDMKQAFWETSSSPHRDYHTLGPVYGYFHWSTDPGVPTNQDDYFFLPTSGLSDEGSLGSYSYPYHQFGFYWTSTAIESGKAFMLRFSDGHIDLEQQSRIKACYAYPFE